MERKGFGVQMSLIMCHDCPKCGGELLIDTDKQIYTCGFCGMTYDFDYFDTANLLSVANRALGRGEFSSARKMFEELLEKDPHDAAVLRGLLFCDEKVDSLYSLDIENFPIDPEDKNFIYSIEHADHIGLEYFGHIKNASEISKKYQSSVKEDLACQKECNDIGCEILDISGKIDTFRNRIWMSVKVMYSAINRFEGDVPDAVFFVLLLPFFCVLAGVGFGTFFFGIPFLIGSIALIALIILLYNVYKFCRIGRMKKKQTALMEKDKELRKKLDESRKKSEDLHNEFIAELREAQDLEKTMFGEVEG